MIPGNWNVDHLVQRDLISALRSIGNLILHLQVLESTVGCFQNDLKITSIENKPYINLLNKKACTPRIDSKELCKTLLELYTSSLYIRNNLWNQ